ncbi:MAG TPA: DUF6411 family protein [Solirubrobacteraceae bacterium]|nr:DUF6411 family protein [Solirubrobacteraceae bacterium]
MTIAIVAGFCVLLLVLAFLAPRLSRHVERGGQAPLGLGRRAGGKAPGPLGRLLRKPFESGQRAISKSGSAGRRGRGKLPL